MTYYRGDPHWITTRYPGTCRGCGKAIPKGASAFYYPKGKSLYCEDSCGQHESATFEEAARLEDSGAYPW